LAFTGVDGLRLRGASYLPEQTPRAVIALAHGHAEHHRRYDHVIRALIERRHAVYAIDHRGHGASGGTRALVTRFDDVVDDFHPLVQHAAAQHPDRPLFVLGHSMGGLVAVRYALRYQEALAGLVTSGAALIIDDEATVATRIIGSLVARVAPALPILRSEPGRLSRDPAVERRFAQDPRCYNGRTRAGTAVAMLRAGRDALDRARELTLPLLAMHGRADRLTSPRGSRILVERASSPDKTLDLWPGLRHEIFNEPEAAEVLAVVIAWIDARIDR
jgi:alpha-beta hydrolase superfamily lysophospholipase